MPPFRIALCSVLACLAARSGLAQDTKTPPDSAGPPKIPAPARVVDSLQAKSGEPHFVLSAGEVLGVLAINSIASRILFPNDMEDGKKVYSATFQSTWDHLKTQHWVYDIDPFNTNQFQHPYQGATMYGVARSSGHSFWTSLVYSNIGEFVWKMAGETDPPSINDMITTGQAGSMLGEALYRMADLIVRDSGDTGMNAMHEIGLALVSPPSFLNHHVLGSRYRAHLPDSLPAIFWQLRFGATLDAQVNGVAAQAGGLLHRDATVDFAIAYGLPGRAGYTYNRPFDYFDFQGSVLPSSGGNFVENIMVRGLLAGQKTPDSPNSRGIWGLYGSYDYISPFLFRVSSTALSLGTTRQYNFGPSVAVQSSFLAGVGYGAAGTTTVIPSTPTNAAIRDYHFGVTPQGLLALRLIMGTAAMLDMTARYYYVSGVGSDDSRGIERIFRGNIGATIRVFGGNALGFQYVLSTRSADYGTLPSKNMNEGAVTLVYTITGNRHFGSTSWR
jgi:Domain of unknown function (DUF3943)